LSSITPTVLLLKFSANSNMAFIHHLSYTDPNTELQNRVLRIMLPFQVATK